MKAYKLRLIGWIWIFGIFFDMMTTIIGCGIIGTREVNPIGFNWYLIILLIFSMIFIFVSIKYYNYFESIKYDLSRRKIYLILIIIFIIGCSIRWLIVLNNLIQIYITYNFNIIVFSK